MKTWEYLDKARSLVMGDRAKTHGDKRENMDNIAQLWGAYFDIRRPGPLQPYESAILNALQKIARTCTGEYNRDDMLDALGYMAIAAELSDPDEGTEAAVLKSFEIPGLNG